MLSPLNFEICPSYPNTPTMKGEELTSLSLIRNGIWRYFKAELYLALRSMQQGLLQGVISSVEYFQRLYHFELMFKRDRSKARARR